MSVLAMAGSLVSCESADEAIKKAFKVDTAEVVFDTAEASEHEVTLNAGYAWAAVVSKDAESWLSVRNGLGEGSSEPQCFHIVAAKNTGAARSGVVTVAMSGTKAHEINVLQAGADGSLDVPETPDTPDTPGELEPEKELLYLHPNAKWKAEGARFAAYFFESDNKWVDMTDEDGDGCFECEKQDGYTNVIFCRMDPAKKENTWDNKWNQTADLKVPVDDKICYVLAEGSDTGEWTAYPPVVSDPEPENPGTEDDFTVCRLVVNVHKDLDWYDKFIYTWDAADTHLTGDWPGMKLSWEKQEGDYHVYFHDFDKSLNGKTINYIINGGQDSGQTKDLTVTLNGAVTTVTVEASDRK